MKKNKLLITFLLIVIFSLTGCTKNLEGADGKVVKNDSTGQILPSNILCAPSDPEIIELYNQTREDLIAKYKKDYEAGDLSKKDYKKKVENIIDISELTACKDFNLTSNGYTGIWTKLFVEPLAWVLIKIGQFVKNYGLSIIFVTLIIRLIMYPVTLKTAKQSENIKKIQPKLAKIEKKYANKTDNESMMKKSQELMLLYKENDINPMSGCLYAIIQIPLFFAFYEAIYRLPVLFEDSLFSYTLSMSPIKGIGTGNWLYLILPILVFVATYFSFKLNSGASMSPEQAKQTKIMMNVMMIMIFFMSFSMSTGIILYWITNNTFTIIQNFIVKRRK